MPTLMSGDAPMGASQAKYAQVAQDEGQKPLEVEAPSAPLGSGAETHLGGWGPAR